MNILQNIINENRVWYCLDCGKCSAVCPITRWEAREYTSPRLLVEKAIEGRTDDVLEDPLFWACLTCKRCSQVCPSTVHFSEFLRAARGLARDDDHSGTCTHSGMIQSWGRMMTNPDMRQNRLGWLTNDLKVSGDSDTIYFAGCLPYYDTVFKNLGAEGVEIAQAAVKILNHLGIEPNVLADERCCGHDQLWEGDMDTFRRLAELNLKQFKATGAKRIVTTCPECARTLKVDYPQFVGDHGLEVLHITELLAETGLPDVSRLTPPASHPAPPTSHPASPASHPAPPASRLLPPASRVTYQDPCRLGRYMGVYDAPRELISGLGFELAEMEHNRNASLCCGTSGWATCGQVNKNIQVERLKEAKATGAELLVTACVKCQIHFKCAQDDPAVGLEIDIEIRDLTTLIAENL